MRGYTWNCFKEDHVVKHKRLIEKMTLEEKAAFLSGKTVWQTWDFERLGISYCIGCPSGIQGLISCTACRYCTDGCPKQIAIPDLFACLNAKKQFQNWNTDYYYNNVHIKEGSRASDCIKCGRCEHICPQHLPIRELLTEVAKEFDK